MSLAIAGRGLGFKRHWPISAERRIRMSLEGNKELVSSLAVDLKNAANLLGVSVKTVRREISRGKLRGLQIGKVWRVRIEEIESYLKRLEARAMGGC